MTDIMWPNLGRQSAIDWRHISNSEMFTALNSGSMQTSARPGDRLGCTITVENASGAERAQLRTLAALLRGRTNRVMVEDFAFRRRGSFPTAEIFANADFSNGSTGWTTSVAAIAVTDGVLRAKVINAALGADVYQQPAIATNFMPYVLRAVHQLDSRLAAAVSQAVLSDSTNASGASNTSSGYKSVSIVAEGSTFTAYAVNLSASPTGAPYAAGALVLLPFASLSRCAQVDGGINLAIRSDSTDVGGAVWVNAGGGVSTDNLTAPDGSVTAEYFIENAANSTHSVTQNISGVSSSATDVMFSVAVFAANRNFCALQISEATGGTAIFQYFNLATGAIATTNATGANWSNRRAFITPLGGAGPGWFQCTIIGRKTNAATTIGVTIFAASADGTVTYAGGSFNSIGMWRATVSQSSVPTRLVKTTTTAITTATQSGGGIYLKGLPPSTNGLLLPGDWVEIDKQAKIVAAPLDSDASGLGFLSFEPALPRAVADNTPVIVHRPLSKMIMIDDAEYDARPGGFSNFRFEFVQDLNP